MFCSLPDFHVPFLVLHTTSTLRQSRLSISCLFFFFPPPISRFPVIPLFCFQGPRGLLVPDLCLSLQRTPFISPLQLRPVLRGEHSITQLLIWEVSHISERHSWMNNKSRNMRWGWCADKHRWRAQTELLYSNEAKRCCWSSLRGMFSVRPGLPLHFQKVFGDETERLDWRVEPGMKKGKRIHESSTWTTIFRL